MFHPLFHITIYVIKEMSEKYCLNWNEYNATILSAIYEARRDQDLTDVTILCEDMKTVEAHQIILRACSPYLKKIFQEFGKDKGKIFLRGISSSALTSILDFMYKGKVELPQEELDGFLSLAQDLELVGFTRNGLEKNQTSHTANNKDSSLEHDKEEFEINTN